MEPALRQAQGTAGSLFLQRGKVTAINAVPVQPGRNDLQALSGEPPASGGHGGSTGL